VSACAAASGGSCRKGRYEGSLNVASSCRLRGRPEIAAHALHLDAKTKVRHHRGWQASLQSVFGNGGNGSRAAGGWLWNSMPLTYDL
jgi:hypothetical protein